MLHGLQYILKPGDKFIKITDISEEHFTILSVTMDTIYAKSADTGIEQIFPISEVFRAHSYGDYKFYK